jgi:hypothetical protein
VTRRKTVGGLAQIQLILRTVPGASATFGAALFFAVNQSLPVLLRMHSIQKRCGGAPES